VDVNGKFVQNNWVYYINCSLMGCDGFTDQISFTRPEIEDLVNENGVFFPYRYVIRWIIVQNKSGIRFFSHTPFYFCTIFFHPMDFFQKNG